MPARFGIGELRNRPDSEGGRAWVVECSPYKVHYVVAKTYSTNVEQSRIRAAVIETTTTSRNTGTRPIELLVR